MIQRIQSVYLLLVFILCVLLFMLPIASVNMVTPAGNVLYKICLIKAQNTQTGEYMTGNSYFLRSFYVGFIGLLSVLAIFMYKSRMKQLKFVRFILFMDIILVLLLSFISKDVNKQLPGGDLTFSIGFYLPLVNIILLFLAQRGIKKDDDLVRSADRLR